jgi:hypothetical protein
MKRNVPRLVSEEMTLKRQRWPVPAITGVWPLVLVTK